MASRGTLDGTQLVEGNDIGFNDPVEKNAGEDREASKNETNQNETNESWGHKGNDRDWKRAHAALTRFAKERAKMDWEEGQLLLWSLRSGSHVRLGYATFPEYIERFLGYGLRFVSEKIRVAEALETLPELSQALKDGELTWSALRELTRVAVTETEQEWRTVAAGRTAREVERLVSRRRPGDRPGDKPDPQVRRHVLRFEVSGETLAVFRDALARIRRETTGPLDDDGSLMLMARHVLGGPQDEGRASYQVQLMVCESCGRGEQLGKGERIPIAPEIVAMCQCDAQHIAESHVGDEARYRSHSAEPGHPMESEHAHGSGLPKPTQQLVSKMPKTEMPKTESPSLTTQAARTPRPRVPVPQPGASRVRTPRATQSIPPAIRREVMLRDGGRCVVCGCRNAVFVDAHHLRPRFEQGQNELDNLCCTCVAHHRAIHDGALVVEGRPSSGLFFHHADGTPYGGAVSTEVAELWAQVFQALKRLGFRETDARRAIRQNLTHVGPGWAPGPGPMLSARRREELFRRSVESLTENAMCSTADSRR